VIKGPGCSTASTVFGSYTLDGLHVSVSSPASAYGMARHIKGSSIVSTGIIRNTVPIRLFDMRIERELIYGEYNGHLSHPIVSNIETHWSPIYLTIPPDTVKLV
jgi:hypothetical protein